MLTKERLEEIRARCEAATPGLWFLIETDYCIEVSSEDKCTPVALSDNDKDAGFIAHTRQDALDLLAEVERLTKENAAMLSDLNAAEDCETCKYADVSEKNDICFNCVVGKSNNYVWRGVQEREES